MRHEIDDADVGTLKMLLESLADEFMAEFSLAGKAISKIIRNFRSRSFHRASLSGKELSWA